MNIEVTVKGRESLTDDVMMEPEETFTHATQIILVPQLTNRKGNLYATVINLAEEDQTILSNDCIGKGQSVFEQTEEKEMPVQKTRMLEEKLTTLPEHMVDLFKRSSAQLTEEQAKMLKQSLIKYQHIFAKSSNDLGVTDKATFSINTGDAIPIRQRARYPPMGKRQAEKEEVENMLERNIIEPSSSAWASPVVLINKKDGTIRFCVDYRKLNEVTVKDAYPLPKIEDCLDALSGSKWFSTMDLQSGFWQVPLATEEDRQKTAFITGLGLYQFTVLSFGLTNAPACFQRLMENVLRGLQWEECVLFMDDTIVHSPTFEEGLLRPEKVWQRFEQAKLKLKQSKCLLFQQEIKFLGHVVSKDGISTDPDKTQAIKDWPVPHTAKQIRSFLGLCSYYKKFVQGFADIARPLHKLCTKETKFVWSEECDNAFQELKIKLSTAPVLGYPQLGLPFILDTDASNKAVGAVLAQLDKGREKVIAYYSKAMTMAEENYCVTRKELLAVIYTHVGMLVGPTDRRALSLNLIRSKARINVRIIIIIYICFTEISQLSVRSRNITKNRQFSCQLCIVTEKPYRTRTGHL